MTVILSKDYPIVAITKIKSGNLYESVKINEFLKKVIKMEAVKLPYSNFDQLFFHFYFAFYTVFVVTCRVGVLFTFLELFGNFLLNGYFSNTF